MCNAVQVVIVLFCQFISSFVRCIFVSFHTNVWLFFSCFAYFFVLFLVVVVVVVVAYSFITSFISVWHNIFRGMLLWYMHFTNLYRVLSMDIGTSSTLKIRFLVFVLTHSRTWQKKKTFTRAHVLIWDLGVDIALNRIKCCCRHSMNESRHNSHMVTVWKFVPLNAFSIAVISLSFQSFQSNHRCIT